MNLSAKEIVAIIKACKATGVSCFQYQELKVDFNQQDQQEAINAQKIQASDKTEDFAQESGPDLDLLMVEDPAAYERVYADMQQEANG